MPYSTYEYKIKGNFEALINLAIILLPIIILIIAAYIGKVPDSSANAKETSEISVSETPNAQ